ncbi:hypothetical protein EDB81DRAFT_430992 [Dactylonectria macrodidyma]|uniref:Fungal STAND N-terminal Goodbye domain-containing protein n=1 Tax=Dactylonectria macrodidyma TaxID=307937 RepID=A0A9P9CXA7_9HYPO|nr:hypothetical protein EDB81DRAFT_430992 [Dactylonectria macrodidyma]
MTSEAGKKEVLDSIKDDNRDVADLWCDALEAYHGITGIQLERKFDNADAMIGFGVNEMKNFHKYRHNEKKVDKLRSLFAANIDFIESGAQQLIGAATPSFPPAAAIGTAVTYMLSACRQVSADYDIVVVFFEDMNSFLQRTVILETRMPKYKAYHNCLMDVFTAFLIMCGFAHKYIELGRFKKWFQNLMFGQDGELGGARENMNTKLSRLQSATEFAILGNTEEIQKMNIELKKNQDSHTELLHRQRELLGDIQNATEHIRSDMEKLLEAFKEQSKQHKKEHGSSTISERREPPSARRIRNGLPEVEGDIHKYHVLKETLVENTCSWIFSDPQWNEWMMHDESEGIRPILALNGEAGMGKSHLAACVYDKLWEMASNEPEGLTCVAHFYFSERQKSLSSFHSAIVTVIKQVVEQNEAVCQQVNAAYLDATFDVSDWHGLATELLFPCFSKRSTHRLYLVLDGMDEVQPVGLLDIVSFLKMVTQQELRISIFLTSRPYTLPPILEATSHIQLDVTREKEFEDLKMFMWNRLESLGELRKFGRYVKQRIADNLEQISPSMLHAEYMLARLNSLRREGPVLRNLERPTIPNLYDLYDNLLNSCVKRFSSSRQQITTLLLHLVAHSFRPLSLDEVTSLLEKLSDGEIVDTRELSEVFTFFLQVGDSGTDAEERARIEAMGGALTKVEELDKGHPLSTKLIYDDGKLPVNFRERSMQSFFYGSSSKWGKAHWEASEAHRQIFLVMARLVQPPDGAHLNGSHPPIRIYAAQHVLEHWQSIRPERHSDDQLLEVMDVLWELLNRSAFADMVEYNESEYLYAFFSGFERINLWANNIPPDNNFHLRKDARKWWGRVAEDNSETLLSLTKAHLRNLYQSKANTDALKAFNALRNSLNYSGRYGFLSAKAEENFPLARGGDEESPPKFRPEILGVPHLYADVEMGAQSYRVVAELMLHFQQRGPAGKMCGQALEIWASLEILDENQRLENFKALVLMVQILSEQGRVQEAYQYVLTYSEDLNAAYISPSLKRAAYLTKARIEAKRRDIAAAAKSFSTAKAVDPSELTTGDILSEQLSLYSDRKHDRSYMATLKSWTTPEQLIWMAWEYHEEGQARHNLLLNIAASTGETAFVTEVYDGVINYLDNVNAGAPLRIKLAKFYIRVSGDLGKARNVLDQVFNSRSTGHPYAVTNYRPDWTFGFALTLQSEVLFHLFRTSCDPGAKQQLLEAMQSLTTSPLAMDVPHTINSWMIRYGLTLAKMHLKMGPALTFQTMLQEQINACIEGLTDDIAWNDGNNLLLLSEALFVLGSAVKDGEDLHKGSFIIFSAMFSHLSKSDKEDEESYLKKIEGDEDESDEEDGGRASDAGAGSSSETKARESEQPSEDEGDIVKTEAREYNCDGSCSPTTTFRRWGNNGAYYCYTCFCFLCSECYQLRGELLEGQRFCGKNHHVVKAPVRGWKGIKDGKLRIEGTEEVGFQDYLRKVRDELCQKAWKSFWLEEN